MSVHIPHDGVDNPGVKVDMSRSEHVFLLARPGGFRHPGEVVLICKDFHGLEGFF